MHDVPARPAAERPPFATTGGADGFGGRLEFWLPRRRDSVREARRRLRDLMAVCEPWDARTAGHFTGDGALVLSELATNAVVHARCRGGRVQFRLRYGRPGLLLEVSDPDGGCGPGEVPRIAEEFPEGGRGLEIVGALAAAWGWLPQAAGGGAGKTVWALIAPPGATGPAEG
ncbi:ATP-binding protein [Kitasatospora sp. NPDC085895]|uniref:ATP-binding protein n=1 Tax=Kitasatospora sp. NPDC085895 TaxID=3155057 RepID=UPI00344B5167